MTPVGREYIGVKNISVGGYQCDSWGNQMPKEAENFCRVRESSPWRGAVCPISHLQLGYQRCDVNYCCEYSIAISSLMVAHASSILMAHITYMFYVDRAPMIYLFYVHDMHTYVKDTPIFYIHVTHLCYVLDAHLL